MMRGLFGGGPPLAMGFGGGGGFGSSGLFAAPPFQAKPGFGPPPFPGANPVPLAANNYAKPLPLGPQGQGFDPQDYAQGAQGQQNAYSALVGAQGGGGYPPAQAQAASGVLGGAQGLPPIAMGRQLTSRLPTQFDARAVQPQFAGRPRANVGAPPQETPYQSTTGVYPGAPPPPGWTPPPPGPWAGIVNPMTASYLGIGGQRPPNANAWNANTQQWLNNFNWFPGHPQGG